MQNFYQKGITAVEILIVAAVIGILALVTLPQFSKIKENQVLKNTIGDITSTLHNAQSQSLASVNSSEYGVHFQADQIIIFSGKTFSPEAGSNKIINVISPASISNVTLNGVSASSGDLYFERLSGVPSKTGTITIFSPSALKIITISATGAISIN